MENMLEDLKALIINNVEGMWVAPEIETLADAVAEKLMKTYVLIPREGLPEVDTDHPYAPAHAYVDGSTYYWYKGIEEHIIEDAERSLAVLAHIQDGNNVGE